MIRQARQYLGDKLIRVAKPHALLDPEARAADRGQTQYPDAQDAGWLRDRPLGPRVRNRWRDRARALRGGRGGRLRRRRHARLSVTRGNVSRRLHLLRPQSRDGPRRRSFDPKKVAPSGTGWHSWRGARRGSLLPKDTYGIRLPDQCHLLALALLVPSFVARSALSA